MKTTLVLGASTKPDRFSNKAIRKLLAKQHAVIPVSPREETIEGLLSVTDISKINQNIDTVTVYVNPDILAGELDKIIQLKPRRVVFNPGTESESAADKLKAHDIEIINHCTLIMLDNNQY